MAGVGGAAVPGRLSLAGPEARPTELFSYKKSSSNKPLRRMAGPGGYRNNSLIAAGGQKTKYLRGWENNHYNFSRWDRKPAKPLPASYWGIVQWQDSGLWRR